MSHTVKLVVTGVVQGVGFRPFLHRLVREMGLCGRIRNTAEGVELLLSGPIEAIDEVGRAIRAEAPPLSRVEGVRMEDTDLPPFTDIRIVPSGPAPQRRALISPDVGICPDCLRELMDTGDRRYRYPFINCTNCGPRFTIVRYVQYDLANTSMAAFPMCPDCAAEYGDIQNRRYHAQPDCCPACGPRVFYLDGDGKPVDGDAIALARRDILSGKLVCVKGLGGMHLSCLPREDTVKTLRLRKRRDERPLAVMCRRPEDAEAFCRMNEAERAALGSPARPIVLLQKKIPTALMHISENRDVGVMLPYTPLHCLLMEGIPALVMTSANQSDLPMLYQNDEAVRALLGVADGFLLHDRDIEARCDDSLLCMLPEPYFIRRSRGYAPAPLTVGESVEGILACGAEQKASFAMGKEKHVFLSQHIGDLKNLETFEHYQGQIRRFTRLFDIRPRAMACDLHPDYMSTSFAREQSAAAGLPLVQAQHHHAHLVSCMADNGIAGPCLGVIWDGTGYGPDGTAWGGEYLFGDARGYERMGSMEPILLPGGDMAVKEIYRIGCALLYQAEIPNSLWPQRDRGAIRAMLERKTNCPASTGMGRLFDGVYSILTGRESVSYEGQGAVLLEAMAAENEAGAYPLAFAPGPVLRFDWRPMLHALMREKTAGVNAALLAARFMNTLVAAARATCAALCGRTGVTEIVLSGGVFQNRYLLCALSAGLAQDGFRVYHHRRVSCNDEGIALGQLMIAKAQLGE